MLVFSRFFIESVGFSDDPGECGQLWVVGGSHVLEEPAAQACQCLAVLWIGGQVVVCVRVGLIVVEFFRDAFEKQLDSCRNLCV